jgi:hypothetical protein
MTFSLPRFVHIIGRTVASPALLPIATAPACLMHPRFIIKLLLTVALSTHQQRFGHNKSLGRRTSRAFGVILIGRVSSRQPLERGLLRTGHACGADRNLV